jgi:hypothetical protein
MGLLDGNYQDERLNKKVKPAIQGGGYNYLGKQETVTVPKRWLSDPDHVVAELAYITPREAKVLLDLNLYGSLDGKPNNAPGGLPSLQGDMGSVGGGSSGGGGGGGGGRDYSSVPASTPSTKPSAPPGGGSTSLGSGRDYSPPSSSIGNDNTVDPGFQRALAEIAYQQQNPVYGDPDPQVDISPQDRDSITSFFDNYKAELKSNPFNLSTMGALKTLYKTTQARNMMSGVPGYEFLGYTGGDGNTTNTAVGGGEQDYINNAISQLPFAMTGQVAPQSMVNQYFANLGTSSQSPLSSSLETSYNTAKANINSILGMTPTNQQFGYSQAPYGLLSSTNMADNPFNIPYLQQRGLI